jgi:hypothetical protein
MRSLVVVAALLVAAAPALEAQTCNGVRAGRMGEVSAAMHVGGWQLNQEWRSEARSVSLRGIGGRFRFEASQGDLMQMYGTGEGTGRSLAAGYSHPLLRFAEQGSVACLTAGLEFSETVHDDESVMEPTIPIGLAWGIDLMPQSMFSLIPHVETGVFARELNGWGAGMYTVAGMTARMSRVSVRVASKQRLRVARPVQQFSVGFSF